MNKVLMRTYVRRKKVKEKWRKLQNEEINTFYSSENRVRINTAENLKIISTVSV
jgi:hypothetical protein